MDETGRGETPRSTLAELIVGVSTTSRASGAPRPSYGSHRDASTHRSVSSLLSADELLLVNAAGYVPMGIVVGAAVFHVGLVGARMGSDELVPLSKALLAAREQATVRMRDHAARLGAVGVIGVKVEIAAFEDQHHLARVVALGTAVGRATATDGEAPPAVPFVAGLTGQDFSVLVDGGYEPVNLVMGVCVYHIARQRPRAWVRNLTMTSELITYTAALYEAREVAMRRLQEETHASGGEGVIGVTTSESSHAWGSKATEFFCMGTAIRKCGEPRLGQPTTVVSVRDLQMTTDPAALHGGVPRRNGGAAE